MLGALELGGTKILCAAGNSENIVARERIETATPEAAVAAIAAFFARVEAAFGPIAALGVGSFGPLDLDPASPRFGELTTTPKAGWSGFPLRHALVKALGVPIAIDTDVNSAALAQAIAIGSGSVAYVTVGTGIGVGFASSSGVNRGNRHTEAGHLRPRRHEFHGSFAGVCPYHGDCFEGLASGTALTAAWGASLADLPHTHCAWVVEADYLGQLAAAIALMAAPDRIVFGGGVMAQPALLPAVLARTRHWLGGFLPDLEAAAAIGRYVTLPVGTEPPGLIGAFHLAASLV